jgi:hypothetical protein
MERFPELFRLFNKPWTLFSNENVEFSSNRVLWLALTTLINTWEYSQLLLIVPQEGSGVYLE